MFLKNYYINVLFQNSESFTIAISWLMHELVSSKHTTDIPEKLSELLHEEILSLI